MMIPAYCNMHLTSPHLFQKLVKISDFSEIFLFV